MFRINVLPILLIVMLSACASEQVVSESERQIQNRADVAVSQILFDRGMDNLASYRVYKDGRVEIQFSKAVSEKEYTPVVEALRANNAITKVWAEQEGREVCSTP